MNWIRRILLRQCTNTVRDLTGKRVRCSLALHVDGKHSGRDWQGRVMSWGTRADNGMLRIEHGDKW
jgi:hypothetical protein